ncbi:MFS transporter [Candidatus Bathyarchaeota archaeon ex4484_205]|nr:MAG: MFS transporter [Candidatus Bathyarchaeota archaeon ex4484_205]RLG67935.1 MAG: MFS transporter [archaeon]
MSGFYNDAFSQKTVSSTSLLTSRKKLYIILCIVGGFAILSSTISKNPVLPLFAERLGVSGAELGFIASASTIPGIIISLPAGSLSDLIGRRKVILISLTIFATAPLLYFFVSTAWQLSLVRFYHGFATAIFGPVAQATIAELYPRRKGERMSIFSSATIVGRSIAPFLGGTLIYTSGILSVYLAAGVSGVMSFLFGLLIYNIFKDGKSRSQGSEKSIFSGWKVLLGNIHVILISYTEAIARFTFGAFEYFLVLYAEKVGLNSFQIGLIAGSQLLTTLTTKPLIGWLSDRTRRGYLIALGLLITGLSLLLTSMADTFLQLLLIAICYGLGFSMVTSSTAPYVSDLISPDLYGSAMGLLSTIMDIGQTLGPISTGFVIAELSYAGGFHFLGLIAFFSSAIFAYIDFLRKS